MRKILLILLCFAACLQFPNGRGVAVQCEVADEVVMAIDRSADQWRCERIYNSDFNIPGDCRVEAPSSVTAPALRSLGNAGSARASLRHMTENSLAATTNLTSEYESHYLSALAHGTDYYVYRLRRLII